ncbi:MAG TPA: catalase, partial [Candidatus Polarisedimenticolia bacterium]|nr:catalase [Candidatus Polarisedimenticolia bacterium]
HGDLYDAIGRGDFPSWTLKVQVMPDAAAAGYRFNPFDLTKIWPYADYPLIPIARMVLNRVPDNYFAETEQAAFDPGHMVPGIGPSPDPMLQARLFAYGDAHRYRLGVNHTRIPVNSPKGTAEGAVNYGRDGAMRFDENGGRSKNYEPNSYDGPAQTGHDGGLGYTVSGPTGTRELARHSQDNDFVQAGALYRVMKEDARRRLIDNIASSLAQVSRPDIVERSIGHFRAADMDLGEKLAAAVAARGPGRTDTGRAR